MNSALRLGVAACIAWSMPALAADHAEAPGTQADPAADLGDFYVWYEDGLVKAVLTYNPFMLPGEASVYDPSVLYTMHFDVDGDAVSDRDVNIRFGQASSGKWGMQVTDLPGSSVPVTGPVETVVLAPGGKVFAGLRDDPFFFDAVGFGDTLATGTLAFTGTDGVAGANIMVIAVEFDAGALLGADVDLQTWATSSRL